ncbi:putative glycosyltransferase [Parvularcula bermudensis HTCC2503]|uniref:Putative glycosyltransferase n=1 Tax=Parvularcula bermudensis (strain ATCC BAA-594 / HTCC2503 / KCTC 12087) TaxID=314260 RepID=E0THB3_PARBH|nr:glycosyltransferase [Parvularcula bermudensis]ADM10203.1 putative glycosyltransferase [Parvularcula bermudensis HTCC2503]
MKRVLHLIPSFELGGVQRRLVQCVRGLTGWEHIIISLSPHLEAERLLPERTNVMSLCLAPSKGLGMGNVLSLRKQMRAIAPHLYCTYNWGSMEAVAAIRSLGHGPYHLHHEDGFGAEEAVKRSPVRNALRRGLLGFGPAQMIVPSQTLQTIAVQEWGLPRDRCHFVANGIDIDHFAPPPDEASRAGVGIVAALRPEKNIGRFLRLAAAFPDTAFDIVGAGPLKTDLEKAAPANVRFHGAVANPAAHYRRWRCFVLTSSTEQMPLTVLEAMASGLPVVATAVGDIAQMVAPQNRPFIVPCEDEEGLDTKLREILTDGKAADALGNANRQHTVERYSLDNMLATYQALYDRFGRAESHIEFSRNPERL